MLFRLLLVFCAVLATAQTPVLSVPDWNRASRDGLNELQRFGFLPGSIGAFTGATDWIGQVGVGPPQEGAGAKYWRDNTYIWNPSAGPSHYLVLDRENPRLDLTKGGDREGFAHEPSMSAYGGGGCVNFYRSNLKYFGTVPRLKVMTVQPADAVRLNFGPGASLDYPLGQLIRDESPSPGLWMTDDGRFVDPGTAGARHYITSWPQTWCGRFNDAGGVELFRYSDWRPPSNSRLSDLELVGGAGGILASNLTIAEKAAALRTLAGR